MKIIRQFFYIFAAVFLIGNTCLKQNGAQIDTYSLSKCPNSDYVLPNFGETGDRILTRNDDSSFKCRDYMPYATMKKEGLDNKYQSFLLKFSHENSGCKIQIMVPTHCSSGSNDCNSPTKAISYDSLNVRESISEFLFRDMGIAVVGNSKTTLLSLDEFKRICE